MPKLRPQSRSPRAPRAPRSPDEPRFLEGYKVNFETLKRAFDHRHVALVECLDQRTGCKVAAICAVNEDDQGMVDLVPFARMHAIEDLNALQPPMPGGGFHPAALWAEVGGADEVPTAKTRAIENAIGGEDPGDLPHDQPWPKHGDGSASEDGSDGETGEIEP